MSWDWNDRDLLKWAKKTLPEFLLASMQDPDDRQKVLARTPWECFTVTVTEAEIDGEVTLTGKKCQALLTFDLDIGMRVLIERRVQYPSKENPDGLVAFWSGVVQLSHFEKDRIKPHIVTKLDDVHREVAQEVEWYMKEGMGRQYVWHALARWQAYAVKKWCSVEPSEIEDPYSNPLIPPDFPPYLLEVRRREEEDARHELELRQRGLLDDESLLAKSLARDIKTAASSRGSAVVDSVSSEREPVFIGKKEVEVAYESPSVSDIEDEDDGEAGEWELDKHTMQFRRKGAVPSMRFFSRYPFLPPMLYGVGGPSTHWLPPGDFATAHPEWQSSIETREKGRLTALDIILDKAKKRREELEKLANGQQIVIRALELCTAIEQGDFLKALGKLDEQTVSCPHPETGRCASHYCIDKGSKELLQMVIETRADLNLKDAFGQTPLMLAARQGDAELSKILLDAGADATEEDILGRSAADMVKVAVVEDGPLKNWREKMTADAVPEDPTKKTKALKDMIDEKERPKKYGVMLLVAITHRDVRTAESSIEAGGDVQMLDERGDSALLLLAKGKWKEQEGLQIRLTEKIHKAGGNINFQNLSGNTPLLYAAHRGNSRLTVALLGLQADPALTNSEGNTALMYAAHGGHEGLCTQLLEAFASSSLKNTFGLTAEQMATRRGFRSCAVLIQAYELAPKKLGESQEEPRKKEKKKDPPKAFDYSKWDALEKEMEEDEQIEENVRIREAQLAAKRPTPKVDDMGPEAFGLPADTPWPPTDAARHRKGPFDYSRWNKICDDVERKDAVEERYDHLQQNPQYEWRDGQKCRVLF